jgi:hypothetical protein
LAESAQVAGNIWKQFNDSASWTYKHFNAS